MRALLWVCLVSACMVGDQPAEDSKAGAGLGDDLSESTTDGPEYGIIAKRVCASGATTLGIDVSYHNGTINWTTVKNAGVGFAIVRVSDGTGFHDPKFATNYAGAKAAGLVRGAYQFFRPTQSVTAQADLMIASVGTLGPGDLPPVIDVEADGGLAPATVAARVRQWVDRVKAATHVDPIVYTGKYFWRDEVGGPTSFVGNPLWIAQYTSLCPDLPSPWGTWAFWQYSESGHVAGISGNVDMDRFNGSLAELKAFANGMGTDPMDPPPPPGGACMSSTMGKEMPEGVCVQSAANQLWYKCTAGSWFQQSGTTGCSASYGWCSSATLNRAVPPRTCVQAASDHIWYQCDGSHWATPTTSTSGPAGTCAQAFPL